jgi:hypothetical protein
VDIEARLADQHHCESMLEADRAMTTNCEERRLPTFARASQNIIAVATLFDTLPTPSTDRVGKVYQQLKNILDTAAAQEAESSLQHWVEASILTLDRSKAGG